MCARRGQDIEFSGIGNRQGQDIEFGGIGVRQGQNIEFGWDMCQEAREEH